MKYKNNFTKSERLKIYKWCLVVAKRDIKSNDELFLATGLCHLIERAMTCLIRDANGYSFLLNAMHLMEYFPEIYKQKPKKTYDCIYWFSNSKRGWIKRMQILEIGIAELEKKSK